MPKHILNVALDEIETIRIVCLTCGAAVESRVDKLERKLDPLCQICNTRYELEGRPEPLHALAVFLKNLEGYKGKVRLEVVLELPETK